MSNQTANKAITIMKNSITFYEYIYLRTEQSAVTFSYFSKPHVEKSILQDALSGVPSCSTVRTGEHRKLVSILLNKVASDLLKNGNSQIIHNLTICAPEWESVPMYHQDLNGKVS
jgi:hypothetical protein